MAIRDRARSGGGNCAHLVRGAGGVTVRADHHIVTARDIGGERDSAPSRCTPLRDRRRTFGRDHPRARAGRICPGPR